jgi:hypothetical protein
MVVASAVDEQGEEIYARKWNAEFIDLPVVKKEKQNTPSAPAPALPLTHGPERSQMLCALETARLVQYCRANLR